MHLISQLLSKVSPPSLTVGDIKRSTDGQWRFDLRQYTDQGHNNAYSLDFYIPYDPDIKILRGQKGDKGDTATVRIGKVSLGKEPSVTNVGTSNAAVLDIVLPSGIRGERGSVGPQGPAGERGPQGPAGESAKPVAVKIGNVDFSETGLIRVTGRDEQRDDGSKEFFIDFHFPEAIMTGGQGYNGKDGKSASIKIGQVVKGDIAYVSNVGTQQDAIFDFILPRGDKGDKGDIGPAGQRGPVGASGKSAYEVAVEYGGFKGGEIEWLASLVGPQGPQGEKGERGESVEAIPSFPEVFVKSVKTGAPGTDAQAWADVTKDGRVVRLNFVIPRGFDGAVGDVSLVDRITNIRVGKVTASQTANVINVGSAAEAILDFYLPKGDKGEAGKSAYELAVENGYTGGSVLSWLAMIESNINSTDLNRGLSAYEIAVEQGYTGNKKAWIASLKGDRGEAGESAYEIALRNGTGYATETEWLNSLKGEKGDPGLNGSIPTITKGTVTTGSNPDVTVTKIDNNAYKLDFILPDISSSPSISVTANNVLFSDNKNLQQKWDSGDITVSQAPERRASTVIFADNESLQTKLDNGKIGNSNNNNNNFSFTLQNIVFSGNTVKVENLGTATSPNLKFTFPAAFENYQSTNSSGGSSASDNIDTLTINNLKPKLPGQSSLGDKNTYFGNIYSNHIFLNGSQLLHKRIFTSSSTFTVPNDCTTIVVTACGGGGGGAFGCGGGGGECCFRASYTVKAGSSISITVGAGGAGINKGISPGTNVIDKDFEAKDGGDTKVGSLVTLKGGKGATFCLYSYSASREKIFGTYDIKPGQMGGSYGSAGNPPSLICYLGGINYRNATGDVWVWNGGVGGGGIFGTGGGGGMINPTNFNQQTEGTNAGGFGAGGGGGGFAIHAASNSFLSTRSGSGSNGIVIIEWG